MASKKLNFPLLPVNIANLSADLKVVSIVGREIIVEIDGKEEAIEGVLAEIREARLMISGGPKKQQTVISLVTQSEDEESNTTITIDGDVNGSVFNIAGGGGLSLISLTQKRDPVTVTVYVPKSIAVEISGVSGEVSVGDIEGSLKIHTAQEMTEIGKVTALDITLSSNHVATVKSVNGSVKATVGSNGRLTIGEGIATTLYTRLSSNAFFDFGGTAYNAEADNSSGSVYGVKRALGRLLTLRVSSNGFASVGSGEVAKLTAKASSNANITFDGKATDADLDLSSNATITVDRVINTPKVSRGSNSHVVIRNR